MRIAFALCLALSLALPVQAQTALPFLEIVPTDVGSAGVARPDVQTFVQNPALLGLVAADTEVALSGTPVSGWLGELSHGGGTAVIGARFGGLTLGVGAAQGELRGETRTLGDGTVFTPSDRYRALGLGVATTGPLRVAFGATGRAITTSDAPSWTGERYATGTLRGASLDLGVAATADLAALAGRPRLGAFTPHAELRAGYAQTHIGGTVRYSGFNASPLPRTAALGWSASAGLDLPVGEHALRVVDLDVSVQAERTLVRDGAYDAALGGLSPLDALHGSGDEATVGRRGVRVVIGETLAVGTGRYNGWGYDRVRTQSVELRAGGALKALAAVTDHAVLADVARRADLRLGRTATFVGTPDQAARTQLTLVLSR